VFATTPRSGGVGQRLILALMIGIVYFVINRSVNHLGLALNIAPILSAAIPLALVMVVSLFFMRRIK
jgi:lipopolysaccharide export system permease protein